MEEIVITPYIAQVLQAVYTNPGIRMVDIVKKYNIPFPAVSRIVKVLKARRLIIVKEDKENRAKRLYPYILTCNSGVLIAPYIHIQDGKIVFASLMIFNCPFAATCPLKGKREALENCPLLNKLPEDIRNNILEYKRYIESLIGKKVEELLK